MRQFSGYDEAKKAAQATGSQQIPVGGYVCKVLAVRYEDGENGASDRIQLQIDVAEGEYKDFFKKQYEGNPNEDKRWKGKATIYVPTDDGSEQDGWTRNTFARWTNAFEKSNKGYSWDWDEKKWEGLKIGLVFGPTGTVIDGKEIVYNEVHSPCSVEEVEKGTFWKGALNLRKKGGFTGNQTTTAAGGDSFMNIPENVDEEIPF